MVPRCLTIAASDSGGGAGIQADLRAFAAAGCYGTSVIVALTAQNTRGIDAVHEVPAEFVSAQLRAVLDDIGADAVKTGVLLSDAIVDVVASHLEGLNLPLVVDPVMAATTGARLMTDAALRESVRRLFPLATVVTPNDAEAVAIAGREGTRAELAEAIVAMGAHAVLITGGQGAPVDHLYCDGRHVEIAVQRVYSTATHGSGCTHSATVAAELAKGASLEDAARRAASVTRAAIARGLAEIGSGEGPVDVLGVAGAQAAASQRRRMT